MNRAKHSIQSLTSFAVILLILLVAGIAAHGQQEQQYTQNKSDQTLRSDIRVDPVTHALGIQIPIASYPGRAGNKVPVTLYYSSKVWRIEFDDIYFPPSGSGAPRAQSNAKYAEQSVAGWTTSLDAIIGQPDRRAALAQAGRTRAAAFTWERTARETYEVYLRALAR